MKINFIGDIALNGQYMDLHRKGVNPFDTISVLSKSSAYVVGNLECLAKGDNGQNLLKKPRLTTNLETLEFLNRIKAKVVSLSQNHIYDHLESGFFKTTNFLEQHNIDYLGAGYCPEQSSKPFILRNKNIKIGFLNYVSLDTNPNLPIDAKVYLNFFEIEKVYSDIKKLSPRVDHVVLLLHWGGRVEGGMYPDYAQPVEAKSLIDAGADLIIGHHSHTFQPYEVYKGKYIFYSLGNFCFSDFHFEGEKHVIPDRSRITGIVSISFGKQDYKVDICFYKNMLSYFKPLKIYHWRVFFRNIINKHFLSHLFFWRLYFFSKQYILPVYLFLIRKDISFKNKLQRLYISCERRLLCILRK